jgi:hypothetical protein
VDTERLVVLAAVGVARAAGVAALAVDVGFHGAAVAGPDPGDIGADGQHLDAKLVAWDARVGVERHLAEVTAVVGATDPDFMHADEGFTRAGLRGFGAFDETPGERLFELKGFHAEDSLAFAVDGIPGLRLTHH